VRVSGMRRKHLFSMPALPDSNRHVAHHGAVENAPRRRDHAESDHALFGSEQNGAGRRGRHAIDLARACVRACVRACACVRVRVRACVRVCAAARGWEGVSSACAQRLGSTLEMTSPGAIALLMFTPLPSVTLVTWCSGVGKTGVSIPRT
jgi:hypothetical protein